MLILHNVFPIYLITWYCNDRFDHTEINMNPSQCILHPGSLLFCFPVRKGGRETCWSPFILLTQPGIACSCKQPLPFCNCILEDSGRSTCPCMFVDLPLPSVQHSFSECCCWIAVSAFTAVISAEGTLLWPYCLFHDGLGHNTSHGSCRCWSPPWLERLTHLLHLHLVPLSTALQW